LGSNIALTVCTKCFFGGCSWSVLGRQACETYLEARDNGGISEISNRSSEDTYNLLGKSDFQGALTWVDHYCGKHPKNTIYMAMANLSAVYYSNRKKTK